MTTTPLGLPNGIDTSFRTCSTGLAGFSAPAFECGPSDGTTSRFGSGVAGEPQPNPTVSKAMRANRFMTILALAARRLAYRTL